MLLAHPKAVSTKQIRSQVTAAEDLFDVAEEVVYKETFISNTTVTHRSDAEYRAALLPVISLYYADYLLARGIAPSPAEYQKYLEHKEEDALRTIKSPNLIVSAFGDWADWVPAGKVGVVTAAGARFLVSAGDYPAKGYRMSAYVNAQEVKEAQ